MTRILCISLFLFACNAAFGQKCLQLEKYGSLSKDRFYIGDDITFRLFNDDKGWYTRTITDFDVKNGYLISFSDRIPVDSIAALQLDRGPAAQIIGGALQVGGASTIMFSAAYPVFNGQPVDWVGVGSGAIVMGIGTLLRKLFRKKQFKIGKRKRLRLLDLNFGPPVVPLRT